MARGAALAALVAACSDPPPPAPAREPAIRGRSSAPRRVSSRLVLVDTCPAELQSPEVVDRVIPAGCPPIPVRRGYRLDGGSLTVEPGNELVFEPGSEFALGNDKPARVRLHGAPDRPIVLHAVGGAAWQGIRLHEGAAGAEFESVVIEGAGDPDRGAIYVESTGVSFEAVTLRAVTGLGVYVRQGAGLARFDRNHLESLEGPNAMLLPASSMAAVGPDNRFPADSRIRLMGATLAESCVWQDPGIPVVIAGRVEIAGEREAVLSLSPGLELRFDEGGYINVGYYDPGALIAAGTGERPIVMTSILAERGPGSWRGINLYKHARADLRHVIFEHGGRYVDRGVLYANSEAEVGLLDCTFRDNAAGVVLQHDAIRLRDFSGNRFLDTPRPLTLAPGVLGRLGEGNEFGGEPLLLEEGEVTADATWRSPGVPIEALGPVAVDGATLTLAAGLTLQVRDGFTLDVGLRDPASLQVRGLPGAPVTIRGVNDKRGTWDAILLHPLAHDNRIAGLELRNAGGDAAVQVLGSADAAVQGLRCARCFAPALSWSCDSRVEVGEVKASDGTPAATLAPRCE